MAAKKSVAKKVTTKKKATPKKASSRSVVAGLATDDEKIPRLTIRVRIRKKGVRGKARRWDYDRLVSYVCDQISRGKLVGDVCRKIGISITSFWRIQESTETYGQLYASARRKQADAIAQSVKTVAEGRDHITIAERKRIAKLRKKKDLSTKIYANTRENNIIQRNRLQMDAAKWYAKVTDPDRFGEKSALALSNGNDDGPLELTLRFVDAKGHVVKP